MSRPFHISKGLLLGIFIFVIICIVGSVMWNSHLNLSKKISAVAGSMDLSKTELQNTTIPLEGEWKFIWGHLKSPQSVSNENEVFMDLPRIWNGFTYEDNSLPSHGYATYQLEVHLGKNPSTEDLALYIPFVHSSYTLYLHDELIAKDGTVATSSADFNPSSRTRIVPLKQNKDTLLLTLHVANFAYAMGGVWQSPRIGNRTAIQSHYDQQLGFDIFIFGGLFLMSLYHLALFFLRRRIKSNLYFGLLCFFLAIKNLFSGVAFFYTLWPGASYEFGLKLIHISIFASALFLWLFLRDLFKKEFPVWVSKGMIVLTSVFTLLTIIFSSMIYSQLMLPFWIVSGIIILLMIRGIYLAVSRKKEGAMLILAGLVCFLITVVHDVAIDFKFIQNVYLSGAGFFLFIFSQALLLAVKFTNSFQNVENLTENLMVTNRSYSRFVPREFLSYLSKGSITEVQLGDSLQGEMTVFFSDIRSYTSISEGMSPKTNFAFVNDYLGRVVHFIDENGGLVNQYLGDGILALFMNSPEDAIKAAINIQRNISGVTQLGEHKLKDPLENGIGIHSGPLILGMLGTEERMSPGVISDTVNTASRIEGLTKFFGAQIIVSGPSLNKIKDTSQFDFRFLGKVQVKGKQGVLRIYEIFDGLSTNQKEIKSATREDFENGLNSYFDKDFEQAMIHFRKVLSKNPSDLAAQIYYKNSAYDLKNGVPEDWKGALKMEIK